MHGTFLCVFSKCNHPRFQKMLWYYHDTCPWYTMLLFCYVILPQHKSQAICSICKIQLTQPSSLSLSLIAGRGFQPRFLLKSSPLSSMMTHQTCFCLCSAHRYSCMVSHSWVCCYWHTATMTTHFFKKSLQGHWC